MAQTVVDHFEAVKIQKKDSEPIVPALGAEAESALQFVAEKYPIGQTCERVVNSGEFELRLNGHAR